MKDSIISSFSSCKQYDCIHTESSTTFKVADHEDKCCYISKDSELTSLSYCTVINPTAKPIHFLAIDKCLLKESDDKKCDCAIFDEKVFCFVEVKVTKRKKSVRKNEAFEQLKTTITHFKEKLNFDSHKIEAWICFGSHTGIPKSSSTKMAKAKELYDSCNAYLYEGNQIEFN